MRIIRQFKSNISTQDYIRNLPQTSVFVLKGYYIKYIRTALPDTCIDEYGDAFDIKFFKGYPLEAVYMQEKRSSPYLEVLLAQAEKDMRYGG